MSWNGTVRCRHCYNTGHNKRSCPDLTELLKRRALEEISNGEGYDGYWGRQYNKRPGVRKAGVYADGTPMAEEAKVAAKQVRRCKYCNKRGHNRRTCPTLKADQAAWVEREVDFRKNLVEVATEHGIGVGALLKTERWGDTHAWLVTRVSFDSIHSAQFESGSYLRCQRLGTTGNSYRDVDTLAYPVMGEFNQNGWSKAEVIGPVSGSMVTFPENFATPEALTNLVKEQFAEAKSACWYDNY